MAPSHFSTAVNGVYSRVDIPQTQGIRAPGEPQTRAAGGIASTEVRSPPAAARSVDQEMVVGPSEFANKQFIMGEQWVNMNNSPLKNQFLLNMYEYRF